MTDKIIELTEHYYTKDDIDEKFKSKKIPANSDLNNYMTTGFYYNNSNSDCQSISNLPVANTAFFLIVEDWGTSNYTKQTCTVYSTNVTYIRIRNASTWGTWAALSKTNHTHGNITSDGKIGSTANLPIITTTSGKLTTGSFGTTANTFCQGNDSRLSNARAPTSHSHGNITNDGKIGSTENKPIITTTNGTLSAGEFESTASNIKMNGTANVGSLNTFARADHIHPSDTNKSKVSISRSLTSGTKLGTITIDGTATDLYSTNNTTYSAVTQSANGLMTKEDKQKADKSMMIGFGTAAGTTSAYTVSITGATLTHGTIIAVYNAIGNNAASATLNVNSLGAKPIYYNASAITAGRYPNKTTCLFMYNTTIVSTGCWQMIYSSDTNSTYTAASATPNMDGIATAGTSAKYAREDHIHPSDTSRAPTAHATTATTYGGGTSSNYGHVKVSDNYTSSAGNASQSVAASSKAVYDAYTTAYNKANHNHPYLPLSGGTLTGNVVYPIESNSSSNTAAGNLVWGGTPTYDTDMWTTLRNQKSQLSTISVPNDKWYNVISVRHRNGSGNGNNYGMYIKTALQNDDGLIWAKQKGASSFMAERTILDSSNYSTYANKTTIANNLTTTTAGSALDATQGKKIQDQIDRYKWTSIPATSVNPINQPYLRLFHFEDTGTSRSGHLIFEVAGRNNDKKYAKIRVDIRRADTTNSSIKITPLEVMTIDIDDFYWGLYYDTSKTCLDIFRKVYQYDDLDFRIYDDTTRQGTITKFAPGPNSTESYTSVEAAATALYNTSYNNISSGGSYEITANKFIKDGVNNTNILLANGNDLAQSTFATSGHGHGNITNAGKITATTNNVSKVVVTESDGTLKTIEKLPAANVNISYSNGVLTI